MESSTLDLFGGAKKQTIEELEASLKGWKIAAIGLAVGLVGAIGWMVFKG